MLDRKALFKKYGIRCITHGEATYPSLLQLIPDPPLLLYIQGDPAVLNRPAVAMVGSRQATEYGKRQTRVCADYLARRGVVVVSGLAYGIDMTAHEAAIQHGTSIAVVAGGLGLSLMAWQDQLATKIIKSGGAVISEFPPEVPALKYHFPLRNRIIAGLSPVTVVTEARDKSGALITARLAAETGRTVMAIPHDVERIGAAGSNRLLRDGATVALEPRDVLEELLRHLPEEAASNLLRFKKSESDLLNFLQKPCSLEELARAMQRPSNQLLRQLIELEIDGMITRTEDGRFVRQC